MDSIKPDPDLVYTTDGPSCIVQRRPILVHESYIDLVLRDGSDDVVIGRVKAEFDFSQVPAEFHTMVLSSLLSGGQVWMVGAVARGHDYPAIERRSRESTKPVPHDSGPKDPSWWDLFQRWLR